MLNVPCVILAGGKSSRMGEDKALLPFRGQQSLTKFQLSKFKPFFSSLHVSVKKQKFDFEANFIIDKNDIYSPMVALYSVLKHFSSTPVFILSVDTPNVEFEHIKKLYSYTNSHKIVIAKTPTQTHQLCGFYHSNLANTCKHLYEKDIHKIRAIYENEKVKFVEFEDEDIFSNLNFYEQYKLANH